MSASMLTPRNFLLLFLFSGTWTPNLVFIRGTRTLCLHSFLTSALACDQQGLPGLALEPIISIKFLKGLEPYFCLHLGIFSFFIVVPFAPISTSRNFVSSTAAVLFCRGIASSLCVFYASCLGWPKILH